MVELRFDDNASQAARDFRRTQSPGGVHARRKRRQLILSGGA
jgi:hypothetical protein